MAGRLVRLAVALGLLLVLLGPGPVRAQGGLRVTDSSVGAAFPLGISFTLSAESDSQISDIRLHYRVERSSFVDVTSEVFVDFLPGTSVVAGWDWDMRRSGGLPPGTGISYWWTVTNANGERVVSEPATFQFDDLRFPWQSLTEGNVTLYWYQGDSSFAEELMVAIQDSLDWLEEDTGAHLREPIELYVYGSAADLRGSMVFPQEWTGGVAFTRYGRIAIGIGPTNLTWGKKALAHELTHLVVHQMTFNPYGELPTWLEEGLAMRSEGPLGVDFAGYLQAAIEGDTLISTRSLSSPFSAFADQSRLSYAESFSLVEFLVSSFGKDKMLELLETFRTGNSYDGALMSVYGFDTDGLDRRWREYVGAPARTLATELWRLVPAVAPGG
ncbi:MAG: peptidase MA family metallohydrolase [Dehalococcoidales bacterium]